MLCCLLQHTTCLEITMSPASELKCLNAPAGDDGEGEGSRRVLMAGGKMMHDEGGEDEGREEALTEDLIQDILGPEDNTLCGVGGVRGGALQRLATPLTYLVLSSAAALVQGMFYTFANATLSTIERRFRLPSKVSAFITTGNDLVQLFFGIPLAYVAGRGHRPRWLALSMLGATAACLLATSPHFIFGPGDTAAAVTQDLTPSGKGLCTKEGSGGNSSCGAEGVAINTEQYTVVTLHLLAQVLAGLASLMYYTVGHTYLDDAVRKDKVPLFLAISGCVRILGPVCAYSLASWCLSMWVDPSQEPPLPPRHPQWIGAWWIGYIVIGGCLGVEAWLLALLPKTLPGTRRRMVRELRQAAAKGGVRAVQELAATLRPGNQSPIRDLFGGLRRLVRNKVYLMVVLNQSIFWFAFIGYITFKPKFLEHQFKMSAARANQYIAAAATAATLAGWLMTGATLSLIKPRSRTVLIFMASLSVINCILHLSMVNVSCDREVILGMDTVLRRSDTPLSPSYEPSTPPGADDSLEECMAACGCTPKFSPVCVAGRDTYYSACFAGCSSYTSPFTSLAILNSSSGNFTIAKASKKVYERCSCAAEVMNSSLNMPQSASSSASPSAVDGYCSHECPAFYMYLALTVLTKMTLAASRVPVNIMLFRCVEPRDKDLGLGVFNSVLALCSFIPAPVVFGWAIDAACRLWEESCGGRGSCWLYDIDTFRKTLHGIPAGLMALCLLTELVLIFLHKSIHLYGPAEKTREDS
ncbi:solute carrier organic anion transporter family member 74D-like isoform X2 [Portunus trituberculatus]|uniref:solute carrier organic anion transporter family member 74D-like isoform X2 n=1 Tax=Portunus trituberculatus TaxID=210409 RepID=UPI001E1CCB9C|nr:solute carrier organic anion transporter family member 74D-like isoform X2 [Portunus trituberculatus]